MSVSPETAQRYNEREAFLATQQPSRKRNGYFASERPRWRHGFAIYATVSNLLTHKTPRLVGGSFCESLLYVSFKGE